MHDVIDIVVVEEDEGYAAFSPLRSSASVSWTVPQIVPGSGVCVSGFRRSTIGRDIWDGTSGRLTVAPDR